MQRRYQVFVSSTYDDLKLERSEVMQALLELECMPAGMELFPATSEEQWDWIKRVIDESDYYLVIVGGRYGSIHKSTGLSYTEMEYQYALETNKPIMAFLHKDPEQLPKSKCELKPGRQKKLDTFRTLCKSKLCKFWTNEQDLGGKVSRGITRLQKHYPSEGWIKASSVGDIEREAVRKLNAEILELKKKIEDSTERFSQDFNFAATDAEISLEFDFQLKTRKVNRAGKTYWADIGGECYSASFTWEQILSTVGHELLLAPPETSISQALVTAGRERIAFEDTADVRVQDVQIQTQSLHRVRTQFIGQGFITVDRVSYGNRFENHWIPSMSAKRRILELNAHLE